MIALQQNFKKHFSNELASVPLDVYNFRESLAP